MNYLAAAMLFLISVGNTATGQTKNSVDKGIDNVLTKQEVKEGWKLLWDGKSTIGWRGYETPAFPETRWEIKDGILTVLGYVKRDKSITGGDIITQDKYKNFELIVDFRYTPVANSGIKYFVTEINKTPGCEYQILDDKLAPDAKKGINGNRTLASLYDLIPPKNKRDNGPGEWNTAKIIVNGKHVEHWLNGKMTLEYERGTDSWRDLVSKSKFKEWPNFGEESERHILLQDHGKTVSFRNIKIKIL